MLLRAYLRALHTRPLATNILSAGAITVTGDTLTQCILRYRQPDLAWDSSRTSAMACWGLVAGGAPNYYWFKWLDRTFPYRRGWRLLGKVLFNQVTIAPFMNSLFFAYVVAYKELDARRHVPAAREPRDDFARAVWNRWKVKMRQEFVETTMLSCMCWTPAHLLNFAYLPPHTRVVFMNTGLAFWMSFLSYIGHKTPSVKWIEDEEDKEDRKLQADS